MFTRKMLKALGIEEEKIDQIMDAHLELNDAPFLVGHSG